MSCTDHAKREMESSWGKFEEMDSMQQLACNNVLDLLKVFSGQEHSGMSAPYVIDLFSKLAKFKPLGPLTGNEEEWGEDVDGEGLQQNNRCSNVFRRPDGSAYDIDGKVFIDPNEVSYTSKDSRTEVKFPYMPKTEYIKVDKDGQPIESNE